MKVTDSLEIHIRDEAPGDLNAIRSLHEQAFETKAEARLVDLLRARGKGIISLVADVGGEIAGHILFSPVAIKPPAVRWNALGLAPLAVIPRMQRQGIGSKLVKSGLQRCRQTGIELVFVLGHPHYYPKFGFMPASTFGFENEYQVDQAFMVIVINPGVSVKYRGLVKYAPEFNEMDL
jgi:putative acetyltransferase